jgi:hypothetical protein
VRWRCIDLRVKIAESFSVTFHPRGVAKLLHKLGMTRLQPRPYHPKKDAAAQEGFKKIRPEFSGTPCSRARFIAWQARRSRRCTERIRSIGMRTWACVNT